MFTYNFLRLIMRAEDHIIILLFRAVENHFSTVLEQVVVRAFYFCYLLFLLLPNQRI